MKNITVNASSKYDVTVGRGLLHECGEIIASVCGIGKICIVCDDTVSGIYGDTAENSLTKAGFEVYRFVFPHGEASKCLDTAARLYSFLARNRFTRTDTLAALGGGVTGDLTGYCAATYLRGIDFVQLPTTLLAQVDSSVGGKTGVNICEGKNLVGAFKQPKAVICDTETLSTLPAEFFSDGMGEVIKYGMIKSKPLFDLLTDTDVQAFPDDAIAQCISIKRDVVEADEFDTGERMLLNFGHTLGHAIEKAYNFTGISHGHAVAAGMAIISRLSERAGYSSAGMTARLTACLERYGLPCGTDIPLTKLAEACLVDKKCLNRRINLILCSDIGKGFIREFGFDEFYDFLRK